MTMLRLPVEVGAHLLWSMYTVVVHVQPNCGGSCTAYLFRSMHSGRYSESPVVDHVWLETAGKGIVTYP